MEAVKEMKDWLFHKLQSIGSSSVPESSRLRGIGALTPQNIPEFVIPGSNESSRRTSDCSGEPELTCIPKRNSYGGKSYTSSPPGSPTRLSPSDSAPCMRMLNGKALCKSAPVTPKRESREWVGCRDVHSTSILDHVNDGTNDDPLSFAAMSLPHFRIQTSFGFSTLSERPHTRRKESLFHVGGEALLPRKSSLKLLKQDSLKYHHDHSSPDITLLSCSKAVNDKHPSSRSMPSVIVTSFSHSRSRTPSPDIINSNHFSSRRLSPTYQAFTNLNKIPLPSRQNRFYYRRRSSLVMDTKNSESDISSASGCSTPSTQLVDLSSESQRHSLEDLIVPVTANVSFKRHSAPHIPSEKTLTITPNGNPKPRSSSCHVISKNKPVAHNQMFAPYGEIKFSFQYLAASTQFKVTLIKAENLGGQQKKEQNVNAYAKVCLMPGKIQKQTSSVTKRTKNPVFNQELYFHNINLEELHTMSLKIKIFSKGSNLKLPEFIGEVTIPLDGYDVLVENRIWKDLESRKDREELGFLGVGLQFDPEEGSILVIIDQARSLPQHPITGPPDPYVRVEVSMSSHSVFKKQTSTQKKTSNPVFEESFKFNSSSKMDDLNGTTINITVFDHDRIRSDAVIGSVILGCAATEVSQFGHWQEVLENPGNRIIKWHYLVDYEDY